MGFEYQDEAPAAPETPKSKFAYEERRQAPQATSKKVGWQDILYPLDVAANLGSSMIAGPVSGIAGIAGAALPGKPGQGADWVNRVGSALTYQPRTAVGELATNIITKPFELLHKAGAGAGEFAQEKLGFEPAGAAAVQTAVETLPSLGLMARGQPKQSPKTAAKEMQNEVRDATYNAAREEGYKFPPSATSESFVNRRVEGTAGKPLLNQAFTLNNQRTTNKIAVREAGLPENTAITPGRLDMRREQLAEPYREVSAIDPAVAQDLVSLREARANAKKWYNFFDRNGDPRVEARAQKFAERAEVLEASIEDAARNAGKPDLVDRLRQARQDIAKTYDIERALIEGSADISAASLGTMLDKGKPLTGGLRTIAEAHQAFRPYMGDAVGIRNPGVSRSRGAIGMAAGAAGLHAGVGWLSEGVPLLHGPTQSMILTDLYQNAVGKPTYPASQPVGRNLAGILSAAKEAEQARK